MSKSEMLPLVGAVFGLMLVAATAQAAPLLPAAPVQDRAVQQAHDIYIDGYHRHRHHHGHVHGNPYRRHLDCSWHGNHEHCQVHEPRRRHYYYDHYRRYDGYGYRRYDHDNGYGYGYRRYRSY